MEDITDAHYRCAKRVWEDFQIKNLGKYHDLYVDTLLLADAFESILNKSIEIYKLDPAHFFQYQNRHDKCA